MATKDELARARILALRAPSQMQASSYLPPSARQNPLLAMQGAQRPMIQSPYVPTGGRPNPLAGMKTGGPQQPLPFPTSGVVRPTFPTPPVYARPAPPPPLPQPPPPGTFRPLGPGSYTDTYYGSPLDKRNEIPSRESGTRGLKQTR